MNQRKSKWLRKLVATKNPVLLLLIRNEYGEATQKMTYSILTNKAKQLYKQGKFKNIKDWPTMADLRKMKGNVVYDEVIRKANPIGASSGE
jgi:hypothetical protein